MNKRTAIAWWNSMSLHEVELNTRGQFCTVCKLSYIHLYKIQLYLHQNYSRFIIFCFIRRFSPIRLLTFPVANISLAKTFFRLRRAKQWVRQTAWRCFSWASAWKIQTFSPEFSATTKTRWIKNRSAAILFNHLNNQFQRTATATARNCTLKFDIKRNESFIGVKKCVRACVYCWLCPPKYPVRLLVLCDRDTELIAAALWPAPRIVSPPFTRDSSAAATSQHSGSMPSNDMGML